jgi:multimeric flavodoxin WrbA
MAKILIINGSPYLNGSCGNAAKLIKTKSKDYDIFWIGKQVAQCENCRVCKRNSVCKFKDSVNEFINIAEKYDGYIFISPVYYGNISSQLESFLTRVFFANPKKMMFKPVAGVTISRRSGNTNAFCRLNMFFLMHSMIVVGSQYWNEIYSDEHSNITKDKEGIQTINTLMDNMEYVIRCLKYQNKPIKRKYIHTNFIR